MTFDLPTPQGRTNYSEIPSEYASALEKAKALFAEHTDPSKDSEWEDAGNREEVQLSKKTNPENAYDVPIVKGSTIVENATPSQVLAVIQQPGMRKKWDPRFDNATQLDRYGPQKYAFYTWMKSPSYFVWARDIVGVQENVISDGGSKIQVYQTSVEADQFIDEAGSYSKSRTRATLEVSAWDLVKDGDNTKVTYVVKIHLNGSLPTSVVSMVATETPMCVGRVRDTYYSNGHLPYDAAWEDGKASDKDSILRYSEYEDGDGSEASSGKKQWSIWYQAVGEDTIKIRFDNQKLYTSLNVAVEGEAASDVTADVDQDAGLVTVKVADGAKGKGFSLVFTP
ncbi:START domain protein [Kalmanozyma brasiliensis GHG001]|uniref:START domain-containing protein n=1 Tax=Kalmanozyma brasiliensis (strain GHG001) TaxID=1365824 RepID=V5EYF1_KALBG|nr:START domain protein [Kalmanozyma brasiliensis GHG001]EST07749.1 START domain protein [Kalmanozyma brasiliensis GHG001]